MPHSNCHISELTPPIKVFLSILEPARHKLRITYSLTLMTSNLHGWEAFPTPGALTHTRIIWALSPTASQVPGVNPRSPLCPRCFGYFSWRGVRQHIIFTICKHSYTYLRYHHVIKIGHDPKYQMHMKAMNITWHKLY